MNHWKLHKCNSANGVVWLLQIFYRFLNSSYHILYFSTSIYLKYISILFLNLYFYSYLPIIANLALKTVCLIYHVIIWFLFTGTHVTINWIHQALESFNEKNPHPIHVLSSWHNIQNGWSIFLYIYSGNESII